MSASTQIWWSAPTAWRARSVLFAWFDREENENMSIRLHSTLILMAALGASALAQKTEVGNAGPNMMFFSTETRSADKLVKDAPYSADAVTETVQTLANGNHIVHKLTAQLARDSQGRTRREQNLDAMGPWAAAGEAVKLIMINDPVAGVTYHLEPKTNTAVKISMPPASDAEIGAAGPDGDRAMVKFKTMHVLAGASAPAGAEAGMIGGPGMATASIVQMKEPGEVKSESLGQQTIEGVLATGTRTTRTIQANAIGNEQPIEIVSETWYSPELQTVVMSKHSDPQIGETTYRLTNIQRTEPPQSLFEVPANYTVREDQQMIRLDLPLSSPPSPVPTSSAPAPKE
jgi:hypothetical protein